MEPAQQRAARRLGRRLGRHGVPLLVALVFLLPLLFLVSGSLRPVGLAPPRGLELWPQGATLDSYRRLPELVPLATWLRNSTAVVAMAVPVTVLVASWAGFGLRLLPRRSRRRVVAASLVVLMVPAAALWTTRFQLFRLVEAIDTWLPVVAPAFAATTPFFVLVYAWAFSRVPDSQLAAARLEGASAWRTWRSVAMPQARAATLAVTVLAFTAYWGGFFDALLYLDRQSLYTLPLGLRLLQLLNPTDFPLLLAGAVVATVPSVAVFLLAQRLFRFEPRRRARA